MWHWQDAKFDVASRQDEIEWSKHELAQFQAKHADHQAWHDQTFPPQAVQLSAKLDAPPTSNEAAAGDSSNPVPPPRYPVSGAAKGN